MVHLNTQQEGLKASLKNIQNAQEKAQWQENISFAPTRKNNQSRRKNNVKGKKTHDISKASALSFRSVDNEGYDHEEGGVSSSENIRYTQHIESYDMQKDLKKFIAPPSINNQMLEKEALYKIGQEVLKTLMENEAPESIVHRAENLFHEEAHVKAMIVGYQNALIFS